MTLVPRRFMLAFPEHAARPDTQPIPCTNTHTCQSYHQEGGGDLRTLLDPASAPARSTPINKRPGQAPSPNHHRNLTAQGLVRALHNHPFPSPGQDPSRTQANLTKRPQYGRSLYKTPGHAQRNKPRILGRPSQASQHLLSPGQGPPTPQQSYKRAQLGPTSQEHIL